MIQLYPKPSPIEGMGLFTRYNIPAGTVLFHVKGKLVHTKDLTDDFIRNGFMQGIAPGLALISEDGSRSLFSYMNHANDCNCAVDLNDLSVFVLRDIQADEELTLDYGKEPYDERVRRIVIERPRHARE
jgi:SET domain-containing protein